MKSKSENGEELVSQNGQMKSVLKATEEIIMKLNPFVREYKTSEDPKRGTAKSGSSSGRKTTKVERRYKDKNPDAQEKEAKIDCV